MLAARRRSSSINSTLMDLSIGAGPKEILKAAELPGFSLGLGAGGRVGHQVPGSSSGTQVAERWFSGLDPPSVARRDTTPPGFVTPHPGPRPQGGREGRWLG